MRHESSLSLFSAHSSPGKAIQGRSERETSASREESSHQKPNEPERWSQISSLQNQEKTYFYCLRHLWYFIIAAQANTKAHREAAMWGQLSFTSRPLKVIIWSNQQVVARNSLIIIPGISHSEPSSSACPACTLTTKQQHCIKSKKTKMYQVLPTVTLDRETAKGNYIFRSISPKRPTYLP